MQIKLYQGYAFRLENLAPNDMWLSAPNDMWDTVVIDDLTGTYMGDRTIDGARCRVVCVDGDFYAQK